ncbi:UNVERIFIED_CONTAM: hypothetical protein Scaly_3085000 [Sesamum calycinum]|uniref:Reverse transcriptase zinc-binding domain-containing protein n=1 Tax=Sesamum calycinum TaxID=2727403 RepID=A0AAW2JQH6_9LAMI
MIDQITGVPININQPDCLHWKLSKDGAFTTKSTWNAIRNHQQSQPIYRSLWSKLIIPNISVFAWRLIQNWIPVEERLKKKGITLVSKCRCCESEETIPHVFIHNKKSLEAWGFFASKFQINIPQSNDISTLIQSWKNRNSGSHIRDCIPLLILWNIWCLRNESKHKGVEFKASTIISKTLIYLQNLHRCGVMKSEHAQGDLFTVNSLNIPLQPRTHQKKPITVHWRKPQEVGTNLTPMERPKEPRHIRCRGHSSKPPREKPCRIRASAKFGETDAKAIITLISSPRQGAWNLQNTLQRIRNILSQMTYRISHIFREGNQAADFLANQACSEQQLCILQEDGLIGEAISTQSHWRQWYSLSYYSPRKTLHQYLRSENATVIRKVRRESSNIRYTRVGSTGCKISGVTFVDN